MLIRKLKTLFKIIICGLRTINGTQNAKFLNAEDTIKVICKEHKSLIRLGDEEINILRGKSVSYQPWSPELQEGIEKTIERYLENKAKYILGMPGEFLSPKSYEFKWRHVKS